MADLSVTPANVAPVTTQPNPSQYLQGVAGATIAQGKTCYLDIDNLWKLALNNGTATQSGSLDLGIALTSAALNQPIIILTGGDINPGGTLVVGESYFVSSTAGGICPVADIIATKLVSLLGVAISASVLRMLQAGPIVTGIAHA